MHQGITYTHMYTHIYITLSVAKDELTELIVTY